MRGWGIGVLVALAVFGCGGGGRSGGRRARADHGDDAPIARTLPAADAYEVMTRTRVLFSEHELATVRSRVHLFVEERSRRGLSIRARVFRLGEDGEPVGFSDVDVDLDPRGRLVRDPLSRCDDPDVDDLAPTRVVRRVLGSIVPWDGAREAEVSFEVVEPEASVSVVTEREEGHLRARGSGAMRLGSFSVGGWRVRSDAEARVELDERLDDDDALEVRARVHAETVATVTDRSGRSRSGVLEILEETIVRAAELPAGTAERCEAGFSPAVLRAAIDARHDAVRDCYEAALTNDPTLAGSVTVELTVLPLGEITAARAIVDDLGVPAVAACIARVLEEIRLVEGPVGETRFVVPFTFTPADGS